MPCMPGLKTHVYAAQEILEHEVVITVPTEGEMKGVLFSLHGCLQLTKEWGYPSETCPECHGEACALQCFQLSTEQRCRRSAGHHGAHRDTCRHPRSCFTRARLWLFGKLPDYSRTVWHAMTQVPHCRHARGDGQCVQSHQKGLCIGGNWHAPVAGGLQLSLLQHHMAARGPH